MCSTPFGITDYSAQPSRQRTLEPMVCSTPFGITDYSAELPQPSAIFSRSSAQRLSHHRLFRAH